MGTNTRQLSAGLQGSLSCYKRLSSAIFVFESIRADGGVMEKKWHYTQLYSLSLPRSPWSPGLVITSDGSRWWGVNTVITAWCYAVWSQIQGRQQETTQGQWRVTTQYPLCADQETSVCWWWARPERSYIAWPDISQIMQHSAEGCSHSCCSDKPVNCRDPGNKILILSSFLQNKSSLPLHLNETCHSLFVFCKVIPLLLLKTGTQFGWTIPDWLNPERNTSTRLLYFIL